MVVLGEGAVSYERGIRVLRLGSRARTRRGASAVLPPASATSVLPPSTTTSVLPPTTASAVLPPAIRVKV